MSKSQALKIVEELKNTDQDFEWYPTTDEIIEVVHKDIMENTRGRSNSILDIGAGDGRVLTKLNALNGDRNWFSEMYAIEKAEPLISAMDSEIVIIGTDFYEQQLLDKDVDIIFCNPPYTAYKDWMKKIITESFAYSIYFVVPDRWVDQQELLDVIKRRGYEYEIIGKHNFENADRAARCKVDIVKVFTKQYYNKSDPFDMFIEDEFSNFDKDNSGSKLNETKEEIKSNIVAGKNLIETLSELYDRDMKELYNNFEAIKQLDYSIFKSLDINLDNVKSALRAKITGCKNFYWAELFSRLDTIKSRLCSKQRTDMLSKLRGQNSLDFTVSNAYAVVIWVIKNANKYYDEQLVDVYRDLLSPDNINAYKSNKVMTGEKSYMFSRRDVKDVYLKTDYRIVYSVYNTFPSWSHEAENGLSRRCIDTIEDIFTVARNLGYDVIDSPRTCQEWEPGKLRSFSMRYNGEVVEFASIRPYLNGNIHLKLNQEFLRKWNVEAGRLLGWLKDPAYAEEQMNETEAEKYWKHNFKLKNSPLLLFNDK